ncbi:hypothetical protein TSH100_07330 [Azospirillum sp. TSH100]|uniref:DUF3341 domain-containing protein n=1 Tax=Azospirillum sp. TSH100 TaxID=652764 RepID=UPI000D61AA1F|nr:DUF3341 domain-containing protein [Azospirillum sp. TSH100]PWC88379.1 hypothetical protein TSH100_07330 [Azospirillum sp. TSH100]QCG90572.1 DUF3341 domain-containing protein [Azospirillum sp. TSH100]
MTVRRGTGHSLRGRMAAFDSPDAMLEALRRLRQAGFTRLEVYSPYTVDGVDELLGRRPRALPLIVVAAGGLGAVGGFFLQYWGMVLSYPLNIGGRPLNSWPAFSTSTFELAALTILLAGFLAFCKVCRLPRLYDPIFDAAGFEQASQDRFLIWIAEREGRDDSELLQRLLPEGKEVRIDEVPA